jgi:SWI/SNF-related matrix-associated actin-dependent regulator of chromatin subfamily A member 5
LRVLCFSGSPEERRVIINTRIQPKAQRDWDVLICNFETLMGEAAALSKVRWGYFVIDEAHRLKNDSSVFAGAARRITSAHRLLMTGTPLQVS